jgi:hypothetical protein
MRKFLLVVSYIFIGLLVLVLLTHEKQTTTTSVTPTGTGSQTADDPEFFRSADDSQFTRCGGALAVEDLLHKRDIHARTWCSKSPDTLIVDNTTLEQDRIAYQLVERKDLSPLIYRVGFTKVKFAAAMPNGRLIYSPVFLWNSSEKRFSVRQTGDNGR